MDQFGSTFYNDDIVNYLIKKRYIRTIDVEKVFRCVNQEFYHENLDYQNSRIHHASQLNLNMPSQFYAIALECLELQKGHKFLNIGSEYGYFNTMAGLLLGMYFYSYFSITIKKNYFCAIRTQKSSNLI